jgi:hypothetical protein
MTAVDPDVIKYSDEWKKDGDSPKRSYNKRSFNTEWQKLEHKWAWVVILTIFFLIKNIYGKPMHDFYSFFLIHNFTVVNKPGGTE